MTKEKLDADLNLGRQASIAKNTTDQLVSAVSHRINNLMQLNSGGEFLVDAALDSNDLKRVAQGWVTVRRSQNRIRQLSLNLSTYCHDFKELRTTLNFHDLIESAASDVGDSFDRTRLKITHQTNADLKLNLDEHYSCQAIANILTVGMMATEVSENSLEEVTLVTSLSADEVLIRVGFRNFDDRFDLAQLMETTDQIDKLKAGMGMLELLVSRKIVEGQAGSILGVSEGENLNRIEIRLPKI